MPAKRPCFPPWRFLLLQGDRQAQLPVHQRARAADAISMEAYWRVQDPVYGSVGIINLLQHEIYMNQHELARTQAQIAMHTAQQQQQQQQEEEEEEAQQASQPVEAPNMHPQQQDLFAPDRTYLDLSHFPDFF
ncbi:LOB domain-containing protein 24-like isoform X2 [Phoenix dactylifera]|uniref:LOB domain-containing protein 24-like isoform X2 n=1 Tax=Phoenix dactylifera TaxID=42345 RepID=A0A8B8J929_PHODC|nr:LOB domain-containing protein 24-like isoform X2 [Phoenix dactylifera]